MTFTTKEPITNIHSIIDNVGATSAIALQSPAKLQDAII